MGMGCRFVQNVERWSWVKMGAFGFAFSVVKFSFLWIF